jgi:hypothetical protein
VTIRCASCAVELEPEETPCPRCGGVGRAYEVVLEDSIEMTESLDLKGRHGEPGKVKPYLRSTVKREYSRTRGEMEEVRRTFDRDAGTYVEEYRSLETGEVVWRKEGRIGDQDLHGPASGKHGSTPEPE